MKTTRSGGPAGDDAGKKVKRRKRHMTADVEGIPIEIQVHTADVQDRDGAPEETWMSFPFRLSRDRP